MTHYLVVEEYNVTNGRVVYTYKPFDTAELAEASRQRILAAGGHESKFRVCTAEELSNGMAETQFNPRVEWHEYVKVEA